MLVGAAAGLFPYEKAQRESGMYIRWYADSIWLFVPLQQRVGGFLKTLRESRFQQGSSLNAAGINCDSLKAMEAMKRLGELENFVRPPRNGRSSIPSTSLGRDGASRATAPMDQGAMTSRPAK